MTKHEVIQFLRLYAQEQETLMQLLDATVRVRRILNREDPLPTCLPCLPGWGLAPGEELSEEGWATWRRMGQHYAEYAEEAGLYLRDLEEQSPIPVCWLPYADSLLDALESGRAASVEEAISQLEPDE